jgi:hypothetical protein
MIACLVLSGRGGFFVGGDGDAPWMRLCRPLFLQFVFFLELDSGRSASLTAKAKAFRAAGCRSTTTMDWIMLLW